jgi:hypothetical protein
MFNTSPGASTMSNPWIVFSVPCEGGTISASVNRAKGSKQPIRVTYCNQWGEVSYPMLSYWNKQAWAVVTKQAQEWATENL